MEELNKILNICPVIDINTKYWMIRTEKGYFYNHFLKNNIIAIGYSEINASEIKLLNNNVSEFKKNLLELVMKKYPNHTRPSLIMSQLFRFSNEIKKGDYVIIPSKFSKNISIGIIEDNFAYSGKIIHNDNVNEEKIKKYNKLRKVKWIKHISKNNFNPNLYQLFFSHQTIVNADNYSDWIDNLLFDYYKKGNYYHLVLKVNTNKEINAKKLFNSCIEMFNISDEFALNNNLNDISDNINIKINLNSPGNLEFINNLPYIITIIGVLIIFLNGGGIKINYKDFNFDLSTKGFIHKINEFLNSHKDRQIKEVVKNQIESLKIKNPETLIKMLETINMENQNEK